MILDSHAHLISDDAARYPPDPLSGQLRDGDLDNPMTAERLLRQMDLCGVEKAACVQRAHVYGFDNSYVCDAAAAHPDRLAAVCSVDGLAEDCADQVRRWVERGAAGVRMMEPFRGADASWFAGERARGVWDAAAALKTSVCIHFFRWNRDFGLPTLVEVLKDYPRLPVVIDHFSNMAAEAGPPDHGVDALLAAAAALPEVRTKFTTLPLGRLDEQKIDAAPVIARVVELFGAARVMWGSDIAQSKGAYSYMVDLGLAAVRLLPEAEQHQVLYGAADAVYGPSFAPASAC